MIRVARIGLTAVFTVLMSCAQPNKPSPFTGFYKDYWNCRDQYAEIDARIDASGVRDAEFYRVPGYPYLRTDRLLATFGPQVRSVDEVSEWVRRMRELDQESRDYEYMNLGLSELEAAQLRDRFLNCGRVLANIELTEPGALDALVAQVYPKDAYSLAARFFGLHALRKFAIDANETGLREELSSSRQQAPTDDGSAIQGWTVKPAEDLRLLQAVTAAVQFNVLGFPNLFGSQWRALAEIHAPRLWIESTDESEGPAAPTWTSAGLQADSARPIVSYQIGYTRFGDDLLIQITYSVWFRSAVTSRSSPIDGLVWRVTLDRQLEPLTYESLHPSGADHRWYPVRALTVRDDADLGESFVSPQPSPRRAVLRIAAHTHRLMQVASDAASGPATQREFELRPYEELYTLPHPGGGTCSLFGPDGLVPTSRGSDEATGWWSGIRRPGALRQTGHQAIGRIGRRHFDDPDLMEATFVAPSAVEAAVRTVRSP